MPIVRLLLLQLLFAAALRGQTPGFLQYSVVEGLPSNFIHSL